MPYLSRLAGNLFQRPDLFDIELHKSEHNRTLLMLMTLTLVLLTTLFALSIIDETVLAAYGGYQIIYNVMGWVLSMMIFEAVILWRINWFRRRNLRLPLVFLYLHSIIEISFPTILLYYEVVVMNQVQFLDSPVFVFYFLIIFLSALHINYILSLILGLTGALQYSVIVSFAYGNEQTESASTTPAVAHYVRSVLIAIIGMGAAFIARQFQLRIRSFLSLLKTQRELELSFGQQVSAEIATALKSQGDDAREFEATVLVLDIRNFSGYADIHTPQEVLKYQNQIFAPIIDIIRSHRGIVNQIMGDGLMAVFGAPVAFKDHSLQAFMAARSILDTVHELSEKVIVPRTRLGIGVHSGRVVTGNIGNSQRKQYSFSGSAVIVAFRVEELNKELNSELLITSSVKEKVQNDFEVEYLGEKSLKGLKLPIGIYRS
jgi:adenylate cyclase